jgi:hypothetical protein
MDFHTLARFMFQRQAEAYDADPEETALAWMDPGVQAFWRNEAAAVLGFIRADEWAEDAEGG